MCKLKNVLKKKTTKKSIKYKLKFRKKKNHNLKHKLIKMSPPKTLYKYTHTQTDGSETVGVRVCAFLFLCQSNSLNLLNLNPPIRSSLSLCLSYHQHTEEIAAEIPRNKQEQYESCRSDKHLTL